MDFGLLPPEINSGLMYAGVGPGPMIAASSAWHGLAAELASTASGYGSVIADLRNGWHGPSGVMMAAAATPYLTWLESTSIFAEQTAHQLSASVAAYEAAYAATVPPPVIAANRSLLAALVATNFLGINTPAIMATEAHYDAMWLQDAAAMYAYAGTTASTTRLVPFSQPPKIAHEAGSQVALAHAGHALATAGIGHVSDIVNHVGLSATVGHESLSGYGLDAVPEVLGHISTGSSSHLGLAHTMNSLSLLASHAGIANSAHAGFASSPAAHTAGATSLGTTVSNSVAGALTGVSTAFSDIEPIWKHVLDVIGISEQWYAPAGYIGDYSIAWLFMTNINGLVNGGFGIAKALEAPKIAFGAFGSLSQGFFTTSTVSPPGAAFGTHVVSAVSGHSASVGSLSVPSSWTSTTGAHLASVTSPLESTHLTVGAPEVIPTVADNDSLSMFSQTLMASLLGRGAGGQAVHAATEARSVIGKAPDAEELTTATILVIPEDAELSIN